LFKTFSDELFVPWFKNVQVQVFAGENNNAEWKDGNEVGHTAFFLITGIDRNDDDTD
jgi:hypothetical protein